MYFGNYGLRNTGRNKCLKIPVSEDSSTSNIVRVQTLLKSASHHLYDIY